MPQIDFEKIRTHRGTQHGGFEELSVQLFRARYGDPFSISRVEGAAGDGGVEAFSSNGKAVRGIQAKFFRSLGPAQWKQIRESLARARTTHKNLRQYVVVVPLNRNGKNLKTWRSLVRVAKSKGVTLTWWGESELIDLLSRAEHAGRREYWFGSPEFSSVWLDERNRIAFADLDSRYTPKHHVEVSSERVLRAFARFDEFYENHLKTLRMALAAQHSCASSFARQNKSEKLSRLHASWRKHWEAGRHVLGDDKHTPNIHAIVTFIGESLDQMREISMLLRELRSKATADAAEPAYAQSPFDDELYAARKYLSAIREGEDFWREFLPADSQWLLVLGEAGSGKSHLLARLVEQARAKEQIALLGLGEYFRGTTPPWEQWLAHLGWSGTAGDFFGCLNIAAEASGKPALLCIDALNESGDRALWRTGLRAMAAQLQPFPHVRLLVSCRTDFAQLTLPDPIREGKEAGWAVIHHAGFGPQLFEAVTTYFEGYGVQSDHFPPLLPEFENPLFLKTLCETYANDRFPSGPLSLATVMDRRVSQVCEKLLRDIDCPTSATKSAILLAAREIAQNGGNPVERDALRSKIDALFPGQGDSRSLYRHLRSNGMFVEVGGHTNAVLARFPYERFSEYFIASEMLSTAKTVAALARSWKANGVLARVTAADAEWRSPGLVWALSILVAERFSTELVSILGKGAAKHHYRTFLATFPWRSARSFSTETSRVFSEAEQIVADDVLTTLLRVSTIPGHPFNAEFLHRRLRALPLYRRELAWTIQVTQDVVWGEPSVAKEIVEWGTRVPLVRVPDDQAFLVATVLAWFFSSNHCGFREKATRACLRLLKRRSDVVARLVDRFWAVNDPYVTERVYCVAAGVAMGERNADKLRLLASAVHKTVFAKKVQQPHVLLRDYGRTVLEVANNRGVLPPGVTTKSFRPPYRSQLPQIWTEGKVTKIESSNGWEQIESSVRPEAKGMYGDFGRYVMGAALHHFSSVPLTEPAPAKFRDHLFDHMVGRRWVIQRLSLLGWTPKRFAEYEKRLQSRSRHDNDEKKVERISKKYQWIALRELQGFLSDHYHTSGWWGEKAVPFEGAWQIGAREFDPSQPPALPDHEHDADGFGDRKPAMWWEQRHPSPFADEALVDNRPKWIASKLVGDFSGTLHVTNQPDLPGDWLMLAGMLNWREPLEFDTRIAGRGQLKMWTFVRSWLVKASDVPRFVREAKGVDFFGNGCELPTIREEWLGEYPWAPPHAGIRKACVGHDGWLKTITVPVIDAACEYSNERVHGYLPSPYVLDLLNATWEGDDFRFAAANSTVALSRVGNRRSPLFVDTKALSTALEAQGLALVWTLVGERDCWDPHTTSRPTGNLSTFSAVYVWNGKQSKGGMTYHEVQTMR